MITSGMIRELSELGPFSALLLVVVVLCYLLWAMLRWVKETDEARRASTQLLLEGYEKLQTRIGLATQAAQSEGKRLEETLKRERIDHQHEVQELQDRIEQLERRGTDEDR